MQQAVQATRIRCGEGQRHALAEAADGFREPDWRRSTWSKERSGVGWRERRRVEAVVETLANLRGEGESLAEVAHDARNMVTALGLYCDLLEEPGVLNPPFHHYGSELAAGGHGQPPAGGEAAGAGCAPGFRSAAARMTASIAARIDRANRLPPAVRSGRTAGI